MYALTRRIPEHQNMDQNVWKKRIKAAAIRLEGAMLLGSMAVVQMHATEGSDIFTKAKGMMNTLYKSIAGISSVTAGCVAGICLYRDHADGIHHLLWDYKPWDWGQRIVILRCRNQFPDRKSLVH